MKLTIKNTTDHPITVTHGVAGFSPDANATTPRPSQAPGGVLGECRCGSPTEWVEWEGEKHELCPKCDAKTIAAIRSGVIPQMVLSDHELIETDTHPFCPLCNMPHLAGIVCRPPLRMPVVGVEFDDDNDEWDDDDDSATHDHDDAVELADEREDQAWTLYQAMTAAMHRSTLPVVDWRKLAAVAFDAADAFNEEAARQHRQHIRDTLGKP